MIEKNYCQHIGIITGYDSGVTAKQRLAGYQEALSSHDMLFEEKYILSTPGYNIDSGNLMNKWLKENPELDGIMCVTDDIAYYLYRELEKTIHTGRYAIRPGENVYHVYSRISRGYQEPVNLTIGSVRTLDRLAHNVAKQLMIDSIEIATLLFDSTFQQKMGYDKETMACMFIPETYQVYWDMSADSFFERMQKEHKRFWNDERLAKAQAIGMTPEEVCTLASIVEEETNNNGEKPMVAGLYINRLQRGMPLQADPTIKFALQDFGLRRITNENLRVESPYNTYINTGLPPGPIRIPSTKGIDSVLNYAKHNYIYMCAKEDFSGTHNFASNYTDHMANARKYWKALNERKIFK
mgnify:CR=1 FL=1